MASRRAFAEEHVGRSADSWLHKPHAIIDNKMFPVYINGKGRDFSHRRAARGSYRGLGGGLSKGHVKPRKSQTAPGKAKSVLVMAGVIKGLFA